MATDHAEAVNVRAALTCQSLVVQTASITDAMIAAAGGGTYIAATKLKPRVQLYAYNKDGTAATDEARAFIALAGGTLQYVFISLDTVNTGGDTVVIDVLKSTGGAAYASMLSSTYTMNSSKTARTAYSATISSGTFVAGDIIKITVTVSGTSAADLCVSLWGDVNPA